MGCVVCSSLRGRRNIRGLRGFSYRYEDRWDIRLAFARADADLLGGLEGDHKRAQSRDFLWPSGRVESSVNVQKEKGREIEVGDLEDEANYLKLGFHAR